MRITSVLTFLLLGSVPCLGLAQETDSPGERAPKASEESQQAPPDLVAIRSASESFVAAFNKHDAQAIAALWTEDGEYLDDTGRAFIGRAEIEKAYQEFFSLNPDATIQISVDSVRLLGGDTAIEDGHAAVELPNGATPLAKYTVVHAKVNNHWLMASVRDALIEPPAATSSAVDLEWLVGDWIAEEHGIKTESVCDWVADGRFLERKYTTTEVDGTTSSGVQLIGWNARGGYVQSWNFSPEGGHAVGIWTPGQDGWTAQMRGTTGDGTLTTSVNRLRRLDDNAYVWRSVQRTAGAISIPDTDEIVVKRVTTAR